MLNYIIPGGRYFDKETGEYIIIESISDDIITYVFESDGDTDTWDTQDAVTFAENLVPANDLAVMAERGLEVYVKRLNDDAIIPEYKTLGAAGFDLHISEDVTIPANRVIVKYVGTEEHPTTVGVEDCEFSLSNDNHAVVGTGLAFEIPMGHEMELRDRSGNVFKDIKIMLFNGTIDSDYRGEVKLHITNFGKEPVTFKKGDRVAQGVIKRIEQVNFIESEELSSTERGDKGFNSTGRS